MSPEPLKIASPTPPKQTLLERLMKRPNLLLITPYLLGILWTAVHPLVSIVTGELKCRGIYIDENGLDVHRHRVEMYPIGRLKAEAKTLQTTGLVTEVALGMCDALKVWGVTGAAVECLRHRPTDEIEFDVVKISPSIGPVVESPEAIVLIVNEAAEYLNGDWYGDSDLNASILHLIQRLGSKKDCPWLAKTVFVVSSVDNKVVNNATADENSLHVSDLVEAFLSSYSGKQSTQDAAYHLVTPLPPNFSYPLIRSVLVLSNIPTLSSPSLSNTEVRILPHGKHGSLPNLDLVFATVLSFQSIKKGHQTRSIFQSDSEFRVHPFPKIEYDVIHGMESFWNLISGDMVEKSLGLTPGKMKRSFMQYAKDMGGWLGFMGASMLDRAAPHYPALDRGIDSLTVELRIPPKPGRETATSTTLIHPHYADTVRVTEHLVRSISNLHERLHHSVAQYTLPSISKFISHGEYIFPTILVSLPMVGRAVMLALIDIQRFRFMFVGVVIGFVSLITAVIYLWSSHHNIQDNTLVDWDTLCVYIVAHLMVLVVTRLTLRKEVAKWFKHSPKDDEMFTLDEHHKSLKFIACLAGIYLHVPLLLANYSLGLPSSVFWSLLLAIFMLLPSSMSKQPVLLRVGVSATKLILLVVTCPPLLLVPKVFGKYTMYIKVVYTALHLILSALWLSL